MLTPQRERQTKRERGNILTFWYYFFFFWLAGSVFSLSNSFENVALHALFCPSAGTLLACVNWPVPCLYDVIIITSWGICVTFAYSAIIMASCSNPSGEYSSDNEHFWISTVLIMNIFEFFALVFCNAGVTSAYCKFNRKCSVSVTSAVLLI